jgi:hypothetical protein
VIPHLTVGETPLELDAPLPIACRARAVTLIEQDESGGHYHVRRRFSLG